MKNLIRKIATLIGCEEYADTLANDIDGVIYLLILSGIVIVPIVMGGIMGAIQMIRCYEIINTHTVRPSFDIMTMLPNSREFDIIDM